MTLSLFQQVVEAIHERYHAIRAQDETSLPSLKDVAGAKPGEIKEKHWAVGRLQAQAHNTPPFVCWIRGGGEISDPRGGDAICEDGAESVAPLYTAENAISCIICGRSEAEAEQIWFAILRATRETLGTAAGPQEFDFPTQRDEQAGHVNAGREIIEQFFAWPFVVPAEVRRRVTVTNITHSDELHASDGATHTTEAHPEPPE